MNDTFNGSICLFPEATTTNGIYLLNFKKGAFAGLTPVKPFYTRCGNESFQLTVGVMDLFLHCYLALNFAYLRYEVYEMPVIEPNEFLYTNYKYLGNDKAEIFQEAVNLIISEASGCIKSKATFDSKLNYLSEIKGIVIKNT